MSTIRTYRHSPNVAGDAAGTLVDTETDANEGDFSVTVDSTGWSAGDFTITVTREDTTAGYSVSEHSNELSLHVDAAPAGGFSDDFNRADERLTTPYVAGNDPLGTVTSNVAYLYNAANSSALYSPVTPLSANQTVWARMGGGGTGDGPDLLAKYISYDPGYFIAFRRYSETSVRCYIEANNNALFNETATTSDEWLKIVTTATDTKFYTSSNGTDWTLQKTYTGDMTIWTSAGKAGMWWRSGSATATTATHYVDDFNAANT